MAKIFFWRWLRSFLYHVILETKQKIVVIDAVSFISGQLLESEYDYDQSVAASEYFLLLSVLVTS
jgi:hypothetical protein